MKTQTFDPHVPVGNKSFTDATVIIIGAGISGMCMAIEILKRTQCRNIVMLEKGSGIGGTWNDNKYPGCHCDVASSLYSYSFEQKSDWSREYPGQEEILDYLMGVSGRNELYKYIRFNSEVVQARWNDAESKWNVQVHVSGNKDSSYLQSYEISAEFLVSAVGQLNIPYEPEISGLGEFQGKKLHSARWDWSYDMTGKRIAVIGNGATAAQIVPQLAETAAKLTVYQRTPNWIVPRNDKPISLMQKLLLFYFPALRYHKRAKTMQIREEFYEAVTDAKSEFANIARTECVNMIKSHLKNKPDLWDKLIPQYAPGCKRVIISDEFYKALAREDVNLQTSPIEGFSSTGIETEDGFSEEFDCVVFATGFQANDFMHSIKVFGSKGRPLSDIWRNGAEAFNGVSVEDLPNFGILYGPNTNLAHNSIILMIEAQCRYLAVLIEKVIDAKKRGCPLVLQPKPDVVERYNSKMQAKLETSSFADVNCNSWYKSSTGKVITNWSDTAVAYQEQLSRVCWDDYIIEGKKPVLSGKSVTNIGRIREEYYSGFHSVLLATGLVTLSGFLFLGSHPWRSAFTMLLGSRE